LAAVPPKETAVAPVKFLPFIVTVPPLPTVAGVKDVTVGADGVLNVNPADDADPPGVVTITLPVEPVPTVTVMLMAEFAVIVAGVPPRVTEVAPVKFLPVITTEAPSAADFGANVVMTGAAINVNPVNVPTPWGVVTETLPVAPVATTAVMLVELTTLNDEAAVPPKETAVAPVKLVPVMVTVVLAPADVGVKDVIVGAVGESYIKPANIPDPPAVVTITLPDVPAATTAVISLAVTTVNEAAGVPPKDTAVAFVKFVPVMVTVPVVAAFFGLKFVIVGAATNVKPAKVPFPPGVVTETLPEAPAPTTAFMIVEESTVNDVAAVPPKVTAVAPERLSPFIVIVSPLPADVGVKEVMIGACPNKKFVNSVAIIKSINFLILFPFKFIIIYKNCTLRCLLKSKNI
jgi:hypothetical protein